MAAGEVVTEAIGHVPPTDGTRARCMFCEASLEDEGPAFIEHIARFATCREAYEAWLDNLDMDRPGGG